MDRDGHFVSHTLSHHFTSTRRRRREARAHDHKRVYYRLNFSGRGLTLNLTVNDDLLSHGYVFEWRRKNSTENRHVVHKENVCHLIGTVTDGDVWGTAALSSCNGLVSTANRKHKYASLNL